MHDGHVTATSRTDLHVPTSSTKVHNRGAHTGDSALSFPTNCSMDIVEFQAAEDGYEAEDENLNSEDQDNLQRLVYS